MKVKDIVQTEEGRYVIVEINDNNETVSAIKIGDMSGEIVNIPIEEIKENLTGVYIAKTNYINKK